MKSIEIENNIRCWFSQAEQATGPILPDGWFGRPYDNIYLLQNIETDGDIFKIYLSEETLITFDHLEQVYINNSELIFNGFTHLTFQWKDYGGAEYHERHYDSGQLRFLPPMGIKVNL